MLKTPLYLTYLCIGIAALTLSSAFESSGFILGIAVAVIISFVWGIFIWRNWSLGSIFCMLIILLGISLAAVIEASRLIVLVSLLATLSAWDLAIFYLQLLANSNVDHKDLLIRTPATAAERYDSGSGLTVINLWNAV